MNITPLRTKTRRCGRFLILALLFAGAASAPAAETESAAGTSEEKPLPDIVLVTLDTVRAQNLGCYGHTRDTSPHLDELAKTSTLYTHGRTSSNWTHPTHISLFTGKFTFEHGARFLTPRPTNAKQGDAFELPLAGIDPEEIMLAQVLQKIGYRTAALVTNGAHLDPKRLEGISRGFDEYRVMQNSIVLNDALTHTLRNEERAAKRGKPRPLFLFLNYMDAHVPYNTRNVAEWIEKELPEDRRTIHVFYDARKHLATRGPDDEVTRAALDMLELQYDAGIRNADEQLGRALALLKDFRDFDNTLFVITSDHGEFMGEHSLLEHLIHVYEPGLRVPLVIRDPGQTEGRKSDLPVLSPDIPGMILSKLPADVREPFSDVFPYLPGNHPVVAEQYYSRLSRKSSDPKLNAIIRTIYDGPWKLIQSTAGPEELYNLEDDPEELFNLTVERQDIVVRMRKMLHDFMKGSERITVRTEAESELPPPDAEGVEQLKALGYL